MGNREEQRGRAAPPNTAAAADGNGTVDACYGVRGAKPLGRRTEMSDNLERALQEMRDEDVDVATLDAARARVWANMTNAASVTCAEFRQDFHAYLRKELGDGRRLLVEDHLSRCPGCRTRIAEMKGEKVVVARPLLSTSRGTGGGTLAAAAAVLLAILYLGRDAIDGMMAPGGPRA